MACYGENTYNLPHGSLSHLQNLDGIFLVKNILTFSMGNSLLACTFVAAVCLAAAPLVLDHVLLMSMEKRKGGYDGLSSFLVPAWLHKTISPVRPYPSWEPQGTSERLHSRLFELLQSSTLYFLLKWQVGSELSSFPNFLLPAVSEGGGRGPFSERCKALVPKFPLPLME